MPHAKMVFNLRKDSQASPSKKKNIKQNNTKNLSIFLFQKYHNIFCINWFDLVDNYLDLDSHNKDWPKS